MVLYWKEKRNITIEEGLDLMRDNAAFEMYMSVDGLVLATHSDFEEHHKDYIKKEWRKVKW